jgi:hypothetical protein
MIKSQFNNQHTNHPFIYYTWLAKAMMIFCYPFTRNNHKLIKLQPHTPHIWMNIRQLHLPVGSISFLHCVTLKGYVRFILCLICKAYWTQFTLCACSCNRFFSSNLKGMLLAHICLHYWVSHRLVWWWGHIIWNDNYTVNLSRAVFAWVIRFSLSFTLNTNKN